VSNTDPTIFVLDDDESVRRSLGRLLKSAGYRVESFGSPQDFLHRQPSPGPGCLVLDLQLPEMDGLKLQEALGAAESLLPIIFITGHGDIPASVRAMKAGAVDFLPKPFLEQDLLKAIRLALDKAQREHHERTELAELKQRLATLTPREREVLERVVSGALNKQIAADLGIAEKTIKVHRARAIEKMRAESLADLVRMAQRLGIAPLTSAA
jgi:RNA polymerase sigma factor (sigma-70 family)